MPSADPAVSVILPVRDGARLVADAIGSVLAQEGAEAVELVVVDDGSSDDTVRIVRERCPGARLIRGGTPSDPLGPGGARNLGLRAARAPVIGFIDHDDLWPEGKLATQRARLAADPELDMAVGLVRFACLEGRAMPDLRFTGPDHTLDFFLLGAALMRARLFERIGPFATDMRIGEDHDLLLRARQAGLKIAKGEEIGLVYRQHATNMTRDISMREANVFELLRRGLRRRDAGRTGAGE